METGTLLLAIEGLFVTVDDRPILRGIDLSIAAGETHVLLGPNGSGKTSLLNTIMGLPGYHATSGTLRFKGHDLLDLEIDERARLGIGMAFQRPPAVRGVKLRQSIDLASGGRVEEPQVASRIKDLNLAELLDRDVNLGFSGGEMKRSEMAQLLAQSPDLALLDEPESGVDLDNIAIVGAAITALIKGQRAAGGTKSGLIVTHTGHILDYVNADMGHVLYDGRIVCQRNPRDLIGEIRQHGYEKCKECPQCLSAQEARR